MRAFAAAEIESLATEIKDAMSGCWDMQIDRVGLRVHSSPVEVGQALPASYDWTSEDETELAGTCAIECMSSDDIDSALNLIAKYTHLGTQICLIGGIYEGIGTDDGESVIKDAYVLAVWDL